MNRLTSRFIATCRDVKQFGRLFCGERKKCSRCACEGIRNKWLHLWSEYQSLSKENSPSWMRDRNAASRLISAAAIPKIEWRHNHRSPDEECKSVLPGSQASV